jgi:hypothetical protein
MRNGASTYFREAVKNNHSRMRRSRVGDILILVVSPEHACGGLADVRLGIQCKGLIGSGCSPVSRRPTVDAYFLGM